MSGKATEYVFMCYPSDEAEDGASVNATQAIGFTAGAVSNQLIHK
jgi:hypothetical protein